MIKLPKEVNRILQTLEKKGFETYVVGGAVRDSLLGLSPVDFDMTTQATLDEMKELFPEAQILSEKFSVLRFDYTDENEEEGLIIDLATMRTDGTYTDGRRPDSVTFTKSVEEDLARRDFTINAIADSPSRAPVDPYDGRGDMQKKLIRVIGDPETRFKENPVRILRAVKLVSKTGFDLTANTADGIILAASSLDKIPLEAVRDEWMEIISGKFTGKAVKLMIDLDIMNVIIGDDIANHMSGREVDMFQSFITGVDNTYTIPERRLGEFYTMFDDKHAIAAIERLKYPAELRDLLIETVKLQYKLHFSATPLEFKEFLAKHGMEKYLFMHNVAKANIRIHDLNDSKVLGRDYMLEQIQIRQEPVFLEDLAITGDDIVNAGIAEGEKVGKMLDGLLVYVHKHPERNRRDILMDMAKKYSRNKLNFEFSTIVFPALGRKK